MATRKENSTNSINHKIISECSNIVYAIGILGGRWKVLILRELEAGKMRFTELKNTMPKITERILSLQLKELESQGIISRTVYSSVPPKVEYELTEIGIELIPIWNKLNEWGAKHRDINTEKSQKEIK
ncbi:helix-turn-helix domain-containing protein [Pedobacter sp. MC2016-24]|uniref:winged helix-turn-helix transcriptional regulator n=1 Tax=Pedobacter sp. MC2016-24 TaxID=2780090 RepID=UPI0018813ABA|nr:helix-turn-helix domain-containing protein [Pedobacter sp. MC2016-24]MBE9600942.1 helix-turn-helix transcriptional regulator [Pedobacter sp. MC2016-24]